MKIAIERIYIHLFFAVLLISSALYFFCVNLNKSENSFIKYDYQQYVQDSIWYKTYQKYKNELIRPYEIKIIQSTSLDRHIEIFHLSLFNMLIQNFNCENLTVQDFRIKYPFAKTSHVTDLFNELVEIGLLIKRNGLYSLSDTGNECLLTIRNNYESLNVIQVDTFALSILYKVIDNALSKQFTGINQSLKKCQNASLRFDNSENNFLKLHTAMNDLIALRNDQAHYRYEFLSNEVLNLERELSYPEIELLAGISDRTYFNADQYSSRPTWGYSKTETTVFLNDLKAQGLVIQQDSLYILSPKSIDMERMSSNKFEELFYQPWLFMTEQEYINFKCIIE